MKEERNRSLPYPSCPFSVVFATLHPVGFRAVLPSCDGAKAQGPPSQLWGRTQELGVRRVLYSKQGRPAGLPRRCLVPFFLLLCVVGHRCCCCCCCAPVGQHSVAVPGPGPTQASQARPSKPAPRWLSLSRQWWWDGADDDDDWGYLGCVGSAASAQLAGICCPVMGESSSGRVKQHMTVSPLRTYASRKSSGGSQGWQHCLLDFPAARGWIGWRT